MIRKSLLVTIFIFFLLSCSNDSREGPSEIYFGEDICERCKMIISEKNFASQIRLNDGTSAKFDDTGCMIHYIHTHEPKQIESIYVTDYDSGEWVRADNAHYVWTENISTPMGYGILSFKNSNKAREFETTQDGRYFGDLNAVTDYVINNSDAQHN